MLSIQFEQAQPVEKFRAISWLEIMEKAIDKLNHDPLGRACGAEQFVMVQPLRAKNNDSVETTSSYMDAVTGQGPEEPVSPRSTLMGRHL